MLIAFVVLLALWSSAIDCPLCFLCSCGESCIVPSSSMAVYFAFCFISFCIVLMFGAVSEDVGEVSRRQNWLSYYRDQTRFSCINIRQVPWEVLKTETEGRGFQHLPRDLANVNALKNHVRSLLLHKTWKHLLNFAFFFFLALFCFAFSPMSRERCFHGLYSI